MGTGAGNGVYQGKVGSQGRINGTTYDRQHPGSKATWFSASAMKCAEANAVKPTNPTPTPVTPPRPPPIKSSGHMPAKTTPQTQSSAASPTISANPTVVPIPAGKSQGTVTLTWDGGPDHPYAEVWVKVGGEEEEKFIVEQGKGTRRATVERGKTYSFILTDSGQQLAKAVVLTK
jgi:hypothetical protein